MENLNDSEGINRTWENIRTSTKESLVVYELKQHKPLFGEECSHFLDQTKQAKMRWLQHPNQSNVGNQNNVRCEAGRHFRNKRKEYLKVEID